MQDNKQPDKPEEPEDQEETPPETDEPSVSEDPPDPEFEEQEGEVLPPEKKKGSGCGFFLFILLLLTGGSGYLYYTDQIPPQIREQIEPLLKPLEQQLARLKPQPAPQNSKKWVSEVEKETPESPVQKQVETPPIEKEIKNTRSPVEDHVSGSQVVSAPEVDEEIANDTAEISGNATQVEPEHEPLVKKPEVQTPVREEETQIPEAETEEPEVVIEKPEEEKSPSAPPVMAPAPAASSKPETIEETMVTEDPAERSEAVQAYLDFVETTLKKIGELIREGFTKGKDFLLKSLG